MKAPDPFRSRLCHGSGRPILPSRPRRHMALPGTRLSYRLMHSSVSVGPAHFGGPRPLASTANLFHLPDVGEPAGRQTEHNRLNRFDRTFLGPVAGIAANTGGSGSSNRRNARPHWRSGTQRRQRGLPPTDVGNIDFLFGAASDRLTA